MNNYEKVKNMTIQEMVMFVGRCCTHCVYDDMCNCECQSGVRQWLESEVE